MAHTSASSFLSFLAYVYSHKYVETHDPSTELLETVASFTQTKGAKPIRSLPDSTNVALLAAAEQIAHVHDRRALFGPL